MNENLIAEATRLHDHTINGPLATDTPTTFTGPPICAGCWSADIPCLAMRLTAALIEAEKRVEAAYREGYVTGNNAAFDEGDGLLDADDADVAEDDWPLSAAAQGTNWRRWLPPKTPTP